MRVASSRMSEYSSAKNERARSAGSATNQTSSVTTRAAGGQQQWTPPSQSVFEADRVSAALGPDQIEPGAERGGVPHVGDNRLDPIRETALLCPFSQSR